MVSFHYFLLIVSWLSDSDRDGWFGILSIGLLILQHVFVMLFPASTCVLLLNTLKGEKQAISSCEYIRTLINIPCMYTHIYIHLHLQGDLYPLGLDTAFMSLKSLLTEKEHEVEL